MKKIIDDEGLLSRMEPGGLLKVIVSGIAIAFSVYHLLTAYFGALPALQHRAILTPRTSLFPRPALARREQRREDFPLRIGQFHRGLLFPEVCP